MSDNAHNNLAIKAIECADKLDEWVDGLVYVKQIEDVKHCPLCGMRPQAMHETAELLRLCAHAVSLLHEAVESGHTGFSDMLTGIYENRSRDDLQDAAEEYKAMLLRVIGN